MGKSFSNEKQIQDFVKKPSAIKTKPAEFYSKGIEELPGEWQQVIANNSEYIIE